MGLALVIALVQPALLLAMAWPLAMGGGAALLYGLVFLFRSVKDTRTYEAVETGRAFDLKTSVGFSVLLGVVMTASAGLNLWMGTTGILLGAAVAGFADAHATAASTASLIAAGKIQANQAMVPILLGLTTNTVTKAVVALQAGGLVYVKKIINGLLLMVSATWLGFWWIR